MTREIKFRAWDKEKKKMFVPSSISWKDGVLWVCDSHGENKLEYELINSSAELMQFTGLHDKNGKPIYEGDVCEGVSIDRLGSYNIPEDCIGKELSRDEYFGEVRMTDGIWGFGEDGTLAMFAGKQDEDHFVEIIGNIYENPELIKPL